MTFSPCIGENSHSVFLRLVTNMRYCYSTFISCSQYIHMFVLNISFVIVCLISLFIVMLRVWNFVFVIVIMYFG